ncbi:hypothetical protein [Gordonibacter massiliensis (ex Traore et al. 2017)]|uniref:Gram-positive cocci surface proteins LPxTG domain-containing protein n=1 Tax=Gordonibacter massiliensis (ex Traore et al. 2017) TaxID=1841863 RepID=A0A842JBD2_9ACTN|nr:hypothetical protein [Gordonibacter massiliensis (ex Traore et al. 2017)]MBC2888136.1 hypothetical protein [Gordonibacter massiliensis (ex Traore et al. 2017)]
MSANTKSTHRGLTVRSRAQHAAPSLPSQRWQATRRKFTVGATAVAMSSMLMMPNMAWAADWVNVDGNTYQDAHTEDTWSWDGDMSMTLNGYDGGSILAGAEDAQGNGDLNIDLSGENYVDGQVHIEGDATITGDADASLHVDTKGATDVALQTDGRLTIDGTTVDVSNETSYNDRGLGSAAIAAKGEDIVIKDSVVTATSKSTANNDTYNYGIVSDAQKSWANLGGHIYIKDSVVYAKAEGTNGNSWGIAAQNSQQYTSGGMKPVYIKAENSTVHALGDIAMIAISNDGDYRSNHGSIQLKGCSIVTEGVGIQDVAASVPAMKGDAWGQTLGTGKDTITNIASTEIAQDALIKPDVPKPAPTPAPTPTPVSNGKAYAATADGAMAQTGDSTADLATTAVAAGIVATAAGAVAFVRSRKRD